MSCAHLLPATAGNAKGLHGLRQALEHDNGRQDQPRHDDKLFFAAERALLDIESEAKVSVPQVFRRKSSRAVGIRHDGRFDQRQTHFDDPLSARRGFSFCSPAGTENSSDRGTVSRPVPVRSSLSFSHSSRKVTLCNAVAFNATGGESMAPHRQRPLQILHQGSGYTVRANDARNDTALIAMVHPGYQPKIAIGGVGRDGLDVNASGEGIRHDERLGMRNGTFIGLVHGVLSIRHLFLPKMHCAALLSAYATNRKYNRNISEIISANFIQNNANSNSLPPVPQVADKADTDSSSPSVSAPLSISPGPHISVGYDGSPSVLSLEAGGAKMDEFVACSDRAAQAVTSHANSRRAVTNSHRQPGCEDAI